MRDIDLDEFDRFLIAPSSKFGQEEFVTAVLRAHEGVMSLSSSKRKSVNDVSIRQMALEMVRTRGASSALFRKTANAEHILGLAWLSKVRRTATAIGLNDSYAKFSGLSQKSLEKIRDLATEPQSLIGLTSLLGELGILLVYEDPIPSLKIDGATFKMSNGTPVIALSLRYARYDYFWFTLMHELSHVLLHYDMLDEPIVDDIDDIGSSAIEVEANAVASDILISRSDWRTCAARGTRSKADVIAFAKEIGSHPIIVAGRLRRDLNRYDLFSKLVNSLDVRALLQQ